MLEIKNLKSGETHDISPEGSVLGREGAKADIQVRDPGVSKKHARIYEKGGTWYLQDVGSSNGTFMQGKRLTGPTVLEEGSVFGMSRHKFKVTRIEGQNGAMDDEEPLFGDDLAPPEPSYDPPPSRQPPLPDNGMGAPREVSALDASPMGVPHTQAPPQQASLDDLQDHGHHDDMGGGGDEIEGKGVGYFFIAVPKAVAYYLAAAPALAVAPWVYVGKGIDNQKQAPMGKMELIAYALPAQIFGAVFASWCTAIGLLIGGNFSFMSFVPIVPLIIAVVASAIIGFVFHPVLGWFIRLLKGSSDARSRSNYFLMTMTASILIQIPSGIGILLAMTGLPFVSVLPPLLTGIGTLLSLYVTYKWFVYFNVLRIIQILLLVFAVLAGLGGVGGAVSALISSFGSMGGGGGDKIEVPDDMPDELKSMVEAYNTAVESCGQMPAEAQEACATGLESTRAAFDAQLKAYEETKEKDKGGDDGDKGGDDGDKGGDDGDKGGDDGDKGGDDGDKGGDKGGDDGDKGGDDGDKGGDDGDKGGDKGGDEVDKKPERKPPPLQTRKWPNLSYNEFAGRKGAVRWMEGYVALDPTNLDRVPGLRDLYSEYHEVKYEVETKYNKDTERNPGQKSVNDALAASEIYRRTANSVSKFKALAEKAAK